LFIKQAGSKTFWLEKLKKTNVNIILNFVRDSVQDRDYRLNVLIYLENNLKQYYFKNIQNKKSVFNQVDYIVSNLSIQWVDFIKLIFYLI